MIKKNLDDILEDLWDKGSEGELLREIKYPEKKVHTDLLWREIWRVINNRKELNILDAGAGPGRFSIPLAEKGHYITHLDISKKMINLAKNEAHLKNLSNIRFLHWNICNGFEFKDNVFDLVLCLDSPLSYCYKNYNFVIKELIRITKLNLVLCVSNRLGILLGGGVNFELKHFGKLTVSKGLFKTGTLEKPDELLKADSSVMPINWHAFTPDEMKDLIETNGGIIERISAPASLAGSVKPRFLRRLFNDNEAYEDFLNFEDNFDLNKNILGVGAKNAGGLLITIKKQKFNS